MVRILANLPLECFDAREAWRAAGVEVVTYGPRDRMVIDGTHHPFDVAFDPSRGTIEELLASLPRGFRPDLVLVYWPEQEPLPLGAERCPIPIAGVVSDYNIALHLTKDLWPFFDVLLCDRGGLALHRALPFASVREFVQFGFKPAIHRAYPDVARNVDVGFVGNLNPLIQGDRAPFLARLAALGAHGVRAEVRGGLFGASYGRFLASCKIGFNRSVRGEMNLRAFEVPACGALLLAEEENLELRDFLTPGEECVTYRDDDLEDVVLALLADEPRRARIARAGAERIRTHGMPQRLRAVLDTEAPLCVRRTPADRATVLRARARAMAQTWASANARLRAWVDALDAAPADPRVRNDLAVELLRSGDPAHTARAVELLQETARMAPDFVPALANLRWLARRGGDEGGELRCAAELEARLERARAIDDFDGLLLPPGFSAPNLALCRALADAIVTGEPAPLRAALAAELAPAV